MDSDIDFGTLRIPAGQYVRFCVNGREFRVASGAGAAGSRGRLLSYPAPDRRVLEEDLRRQLAANGAVYTKIRFNDHLTQELAAPGLYPIRMVTKRMLGAGFAPAADLWALWEYEGEDLRSRYNRLNGRLQVPIGPRPGRENGTPALAA